MGGGQTALREHDTVSGVYGTVEQMSLEVARRKQCLGSVG